MDKPGWVTVASTGPAQMAPSIFEEVVRMALDEERVGWIGAVAPIEYVHDGNVIPESMVFATESQKGN